MCIPKVVFLVGLVDGLSVPRAGLTQVPGGGEVKSFVQGFIDRLLALKGQES